MVSKLAVLTVARKEPLANAKSLWLTRSNREEGDTTPGDWTLIELEPSEKESMFLDEISQLHIFILVTDQYLSQVKFVQFPRKRHFTNLHSC